MSIIVDTSVWSLAFRRTSNQPDPYIEALTVLITHGRVVMIGAVRQELLSGIRHEKQYRRLQTSLRAFPNLGLTIEDYEVGAEYYNFCRKNGVQGSNTDFLICAASVLRGYDILTTDKDFDEFAKHLPISLLAVFG